MFAIHVTQFAKMYICDYSGVGGVVDLQLSECGHVASQLSSHPYQFIYTIWKKSDKGYYQLPVVHVLDHMENTPSPSLISH